MDKALILHWLVRDAEEYGDEMLREWEQQYPQEERLTRTLAELNNRREVDLPCPLPDDPKKMVRVLRRHLRDNVTLISLVLNWHFPRDYLFYRVSSLENEVFDGLAFLADVVPEFNLPFSAVGKRGFDRYLELNSALLKFAARVWPKKREPQGRIAWFLYQGLGSLFLERRQYRRYWLMVADPELMGDN